MKVLLKKMALALLLFGGISFSTNAAEIGVNMLNNLGNVVPGEQCELKTFGDYYLYTPTENADIIIQTNYSGSINNLVFTPNNQSYFMFYKYTDFYMQSNVGSYSMTEGVGWRLVFDVKAGQEYAFAYTELLRLSVNDGSNEEDVPLGFTLTVGNDNLVEAVMTYCLPTPGTTFDEGLGINDITMEFDQSVKSVGNVYLEFTNLKGENQIIPVEKNDTIGYYNEGKLLVVRVANTNSVYAKAKSQADFEKPFYLKIDNLICATGPVTSAKLSEGQQFVKADAEGNVSVEYNFMEGAKLVNATWPEKFYSYWTPGDEAGMAVLTFDSPITLRAASLMLIMGHIYRGSSSGEDPDNSWAINASLDETKTVLTLNFTGVNYGAGLEKEFNEVTLMLSGIYGENGMVAIMGNGLGYLDKYLPFSNEPYGDAKVPESMKDSPVPSLAQGEDLPVMENLILSWNQPVSLVEGMIAEGLVAFGNYTPVAVPLSVNESGDLVIELSKVEVPLGTYTGQMDIQIPAGVVADAEGNVNAPLTLTYFAVNVTGIDSLLTDPSAVKGVYNIKGVKVSDSIETLPSGLYIVNGKKIIVK